MTPHVPGGMRAMDVLADTPSPRLLDWGSVWASDDAPRPGRDARDGCPCGHAIAVSTGLCHRGEGLAVKALGPTLTSPMLSSATGNHLFCRSGSAHPRGGLIVGNLGDAVGKPTGCHEGNREELCAILRCTISGG